MEAKTFVFFLLTFLSPIFGEEDHHHEDGGHGTCCNKKRVNGILYQLVHPERHIDTGRYGCDSECIYEKDENPGQRFCFGLGDYQPECLDAQYWGYGALERGPETWARTFPDFCAGSHQSPIDFITNEIPTASPDPGQISFIDYDVAMHGELTNDGHTLGFHFTEAGPRPRITGGSLGDREFEFFELHWHWGSNNSQGSEHRVDGQMYPMELHIVHINTAYGDEWPSYPDGLAVLGFFYELSTEDNENLWDLLDGLENLESEVALLNSSMRQRVGPSGKEDVFSVEVDAEISLNQMMNAGGPGPEYFYYDGSVTTPACQEVVTWAVYLEKVPISEAQLQIFRGLVDSQGVTLNNNYRPPQPINGRTVLKRG